MRKYGKRERGICPSCGRDVALAAVYMRPDGVKTRAYQGQARQHLAPVDAREGKFWTALGRRYCNGGLARPIAASPTAGDSGVGPSERAPLGAPAGPGGRTHE